MAATSEIEKLERRYAENPEGRFFAPLADAYRKAGQADRALELVRAGLEKHPDYLSAHIVLGRCYLDKQDDEGAGQAFQRVLGLDAENIIALKSLAEIEERRGDLVRAREWLQQLLKVDPMNAEAEADLQRLGGAIGAADTMPMAAISLEESAPSAEISFADVAPAEPDPASALGLEPTAFGAAVDLPEPTGLDGIETVEFAPPTEPVPPPDVEVAPFDDALAWGTGERSSRAVSADDVQRALGEHEASLEAPSAELLPPDGAVEHVAGDHLALEEPASGAGDSWAVRASLQTKAPDLTTFEVPDQDAPAWPEAGSEQAVAEFSLPESEGAEVVAGSGNGGELEMPELAPAELAEPEQGLADLPLIMPEDVTPPEEMARPSSKHAAVEEPAETAAALEAPPLLTETMGDLYLRQGFRAEAADVYRRLLEQRSGDEGLLAKLASIEGPPPSMSATALGSESSGSWLRRLAQARLCEPAAAAVPDVPDGPSPMEQAFAQPEPEPAPVEPAGEPTRPAQDSFTLDAIFGAQGAAPAPPLPEPPPPTGTSFDEFFGAPTEQGSVRPGAETSEPAADVPPEDDINSFNAWLHGLKR